MSSINFSEVAVMLLIIEKQLGIQNSEYGASWINKIGQKIKTPVNLVILEHSSAIGHSASFDNFTITSRNSIPSDFSFMKAF